MTIYSVALFLHVTATLTLVSALSLEAVAVARLRREVTAGELISLQGLTSVVPFLSAASLVVLFFSGGFMTDRRAEWVLAWPKVALAMLVAMGAMGGIAGRYLRNIRRASESREALETTSISAKWSNALMMLLHQRMALVLGAVLLMTVQPRWQGSLCVLAASLLLGLVLLSISRRRWGKLSPLTRLS